jgi:hypothetical protein
VHASLTRKQSGEFLTTPLGMAGAVLERVLVDEPIEVVRQGAGHFGRATGAGAIHQALDSLAGEAMDPFAQRGVDTHGLTPVAPAKEVCIYLEGCMPSNSLYGWHSPTPIKVWSSAIF